MWDSGTVASAWSCPTAPHSTSRPIRCLAIWWYTARSRLPICAWSPSAMLPAASTLPPVACRTPAPTGWRQAGHLQAACGSPCRRPAQEYRVRYTHWRCACHADRVSRYALAQRRGRARALGVAQHHRGRDGRWPGRPGRELRRPADTGQADAGGASADRDRCVRECSAPSPHCAAPAIPPGCTVMRSADRRCMASLRLR